MARLALGVAGAAAGSLIGQPGLGFALGTVAGSYLFPEDLGTTKGPRLDDRQVMSADEGTDIPYGWGTIPVPGQIIWADEIKEKTTTTDQGGKGGAATSSYKEYSYTCTFAVSFGLIKSDFIRRLWFNGELVRDNTSGTETAAKSGINFAEYLGTETQEPDQFIEAIVGTGNAPAYRGHTYIVFVNLPLAEYGNRIPSIVAEIVTSGTSVSDVLDSVIWETTVAQTTPNMQYDPINDVCYYSEQDDNGDVDHVHKIDPYTGLVIQNFESGGAAITPSKFLVYSYELGINNRLFMISPGQARVWNTETGNLVLSGATGFLGSGTVRFRELNGYIVWALNNFGANPMYVWSKSDTSAVPYAVANPASYTVTTSRSMCGICVKDEYSVYVPVERNSDSNPGYCTFTPDGTTAVYSDFVDLTMPDAEAGRTWQFQDGILDTINNYLWFNIYSAHATNPDYNYWIALNPSDGAIAHQVTSFSEPTCWPVFASTFDESTQAIYSYSGSDSKVYRLNVATATMDSWTITWSGVGNSISGFSTAWYHGPTNRVLMYGRNSVANESHMLRVRLDNVSTTDIPVATIIADVCADVDITAAQIDTTALTETVEGYRVMRQAPARSILEPVLNAKQIDVVQSDYKLKFVPRGSASALTVTADDLGSNEGDIPSDQILSERLPQGIDLPKSVDLQYISSDRDLQPGSVRAMWAAAGRERAMSLNLSLVMDDDEATYLANVFLQEAHELREYTFTLPPPYYYLEPTDVITLPVNDSYSVTVKLTKTNRTQNGLECEAIRVDAEHLTANVVGGGSVASDATINGAGTPQPVIIDGPLLRDIDNDHPGPYITAYTYGGGFLPAGVYVSTDGQSYVPQGTVSTEPLIGLVPATPTTGIDWEDYDTTNTVVVTVIAGSGAFESATDAQLLAGKNAAAWGRAGRWEIIQWKTATDNGDNTYDLDDLLRGRRGTNRNADLHEANDLFVMLDTNAIVRLINAVADIGNAIYYKIVPDGQPIGNYAPRTWTVGNIPLLPYCPINVTGTDAGGGTLQIDWDRRTRRGGFYGGANTLTDQVGGSISEDSEEYELDIYDSADLGTVVRAVTGLSTNTYDYTSAQWTADGFVSTDTIVVRIYQISATVDRGTQSDDATLTIP